MIHRKVKISRVKLLPLPVANPKTWNEGAPAAAAEMTIYGIVPVYDIIQSQE